MDQPHFCHIKFEFSLSVVLTVVDITAQLFLTVLFKINGADIMIKAFLYLFGCFLTVSATILLIACAGISSSCLRLLLVDATLGVSSASLIWKLYFILFVAFHWIVLRKGYYWDSTERKFILRVNSNQKRMSSNFDQIRTSELVETSVKLHLEGDVTCENLMIKEGHRLETGKQQMYEEISLQTNTAIQNLQKNVAYYEVGLKKSVQTLELKENVAYEMLKATFALEENVAYQGTGGQHSTSIYETIN